MEKDLRYLDIMFMKDAEHFRIYQEAVARNSWESKVHTRVVIPPKVLKRIQHPELAELIKSLNETNRIRHTQDMVLERYNRRYRKR